MTVAKSRRLKPQQPGEVSVIKKALIIGGGVAGMSAALSVAEQGYDAFLVERQPELGGIMRSLYRIFPNKDDAEALLQELKTKLEANPKVKVFTNTNIKDVGGYVGNFEITLDQDGEENNLKVGAVIVATGGNERKPEGLFGYGKYPNVITQLELEGKLKNNEVGDVKKVVMILCAGARQEEGEFTYCSKVCCGASIKNAYLLKNMDPDMDVTILYRDIQMAGKENEEFYREVRENVTFTRYSLDDPPEVSDKDGKLLIKFKDILVQSEAELEADLLVLATPMVPQEDSEQISQFLKIPVMRGIPPFFLEAHVKLRPLDFATDGVFLCGAAQWPKPIEECVSQATGAAERACQIFAKGRIVTAGITMVIDESRCIGCGRCEEVCPYSAIERYIVETEFENTTLVDEKSRIIQAMCKGCGTCSVECPVEAITARHFTTEQLDSMIDAYLIEEGEYKLGEVENE
jgi:heterodisulfide reductase subunit A